MAPDRRENERVMGRERHCASSAWVTCAAHGPGAGDRLPRERGTIVLESRSRCIRRTRKDRLNEISGHPRTKSREPPGCGWTETVGAIRGSCGMSLAAPE